MVERTATYRVVFDTREAEQRHAAYQRATQRTEASIRASERAHRQQRDEFGKFVGASDAVTRSVRQQAFSHRDVIAALGGYVVISRVARGFRDLVGSMTESAGAAQEIESRFRVVFGSTAPEASRQLELLAERAGRSEVGLRKGAAGLQDFLVPLGIARDDAAALSVDLTELAVDVGSFVDQADADVLTRFSSAIAGNSEAVRLLGINTQETQVQAEALRLGFAASAAELTIQDKALARISLLFAQTSDAQGDAERTADSYANTVKRVTGEVDDLEAALGVRLTDAYGRALNDTIGFDTAMTSLSLSLGAVAGAGEFVIDVLAGVGAAARDAIGFIAELPDIPAVGPLVGLAGIQDVAQQFERVEAAAEFRRVFAAARGSEALENRPDLAFALNELQLSGNVGAVAAGREGAVEDLRKVTDEARILAGGAEIDRIRAALPQIDDRTFREARENARELAESLLDTGVLETQGEVWLRVARDLGEKFQAELRAAGIVANREALDEALQAAQRNVSPDAPGRGIGVTSSGQDIRRTLARQDRQRERAIDAEAVRFAQEYRLEITGIDSIFTNATSSLDRFAAGHTSLEGAVQGFWRGLADDMRAAAIEAIALEGIMRPLLQSLGASDGVIGRLVPALAGSGSGDGASTASLISPFVGGYGANGSQRQG